MKPELGIYIHIPFCIQKCIYCDFVSYPNKLNLQSDYIEKLIKEIDGEKELFDKYNVTTIYIGGGTPSAIESKNIVKILEKIKQVIKIEDLRNIETTIEINPGTITKQKLLDYKQEGINRISIGLQSTNDKILKNIGRIHSYRDFLDSYQLIRSIGFNNVNVDLMIGLPNQTIKDIKESIEKIVNSKYGKPEHISTYSLIIEPNTQIEKLIDENKMKLPTDEEERKQYDYVKNMLELNEYEHYEISNFALKGKRSKHNTNCWEQKEYIGFGVAAHSYINKKRFSNTENLNTYLQKDYKEIKTIHEIQNIEEEQKEYMLLGLRKIDGIEISKFKEKFNGINPIFLFRNELEKLTKQKLIKIDLDNIKLTKKGLDLANIVWEEFI